MTQHKRRGRDGKAKRKATADAKTELTLLTDMVADADEEKPKGHAGK